MSMLIDMESIGMYQYELRRNVQTYFFHEQHRNCRWETTHSDCLPIAEPNRYICLDTHADAFAHWVFESAIYLPLFQFLKYKYPNCKIWIRNKRSYKYLFTRFLGIHDTDIVFEPAEGANECIFPEPIMWLNDEKEPRWEMQVRAFHNLLHGVVNKTVDVCLMPRQSKENAVYFPRTYNVQPIRDALSALSISHSVCETDGIQTLDEQIHAVRSAKFVIVTDGSPFWVNGLLSKQATIIILGHDCEKISRMHARYQFLYTMILEQNISVHTVRYHVPTNSMANDTFGWSDIEPFITKMNKTTMRVFVNGFWGGFLEGTDGVHVGLFIRLFQSVFQKSVEFTNDIYSADSLLESHFSPSVFGLRPWKTSVFFSGEGSIPLPAHANQYTLVLGAQAVEGNFVPLPLAVCYDLCKPHAYNTRQDNVPPNDVCAIISSPITEGRFRYKLIEELRANGIQVDMWGRYQNNMGRAVEGSYFEAPILALQSSYKIVLALENTESDHYITEKILNPLRAGVVPVYFGSSRVDEYIQAGRIIQVKPDTVGECVAEIRRLCMDEEAWKQKVQLPIFEKTSEKLFEEVIRKCKIVLFRQPYQVEMIGNPAVESNREQSYAMITQFYGIQPWYEVYGEAAKYHPLAKRFDTTKKIQAISLAINHIAIFKRYAYTNQYVVIFENDAIPLQPMNVIHTQIQNDIEVMKEKGIEFAFLGRGSSDHPIDKNSLGGALYRMNKSRCCESYIVSPKGILRFLDWFYSKINHDVIDWAYNHYYAEFPDRIVAWRDPELFVQGSIVGLYSSLVPR